MWNFEGAEAQFESCEGERNFISVIIFIIIPLPILKIILNWKKINGTLPDFLTIYVHN